MKNKMEGHFTLSQQVGMEVGAVICHFLKWPFLPIDWENRSFNAYLTSSPRHHKLYFRKEATVTIYLDPDNEQSNQHHGWVPTKVKVEWIELIDERKVAFRTTTLTDFSQDESGIWQFSSGSSEERIC